MLHSKILLTLLSILMLPLTALGWGRGHKLIRTWAVEKLPDWQQQRIGTQHLKALCTQYTSLQDHFASGKRRDLASYCTIPGVRVSLHDVNAIGPSVQGMQWYLQRIRRELKANRIDEAMKFLGVLCHWNEDPGCPSAHSSPVSEQTLRLLLPPPSAKQNLNYLYGYGGIADVGNYSLAKEKYQPKLLGATIPEAAARIYQHQRLLQRHAASLIVPLVQDMMYGDGKKADQVRAKAALVNARHTADVIYTALCLAYDRVNLTESARLKTQKLTDWLPEPPSRRMISRPYYVVPYLVNQSMDARRKLHPLSFSGVGSEAKVAFGFGTGTPSDLDYSLAPGGVYDKFTCRAGLHSTAGENAKVIFVVLVNGKSVFRSSPIEVDSKPVRIQVTLPRKGVTKLTLRTIASEGSRPEEGLTVWAEPMLHRSEQ